jgi:hypothetical protein
MTNVDEVRDRAHRTAWAVSADGRLVAATVMSLSHAIQLRALWLSWQPSSRNVQVRIEQVRL